MQFEWIGDAHMTQLRCITSLLPYQKARTQPTSTCPNQTRRARTRGLGGDMCILPIVQGFHEFLHLFLTRFDEGLALFIQPMHGISVPNTLSFLSAHQLTPSKGRCMKKSGHVNRTSQTSHPPSQCSVSRTRMAFTRARFSWVGCRDAAHGSPNKSARLSKICPTFCLSIPTIQSKKIKSICHYHMRAGLLSYKM